MPEQLSEDLVQFRTIILSLVSYAMHPRLDTLIGKLAPEQTPSKRFLIKLEIKRLAKPCPYVLDLRNYFEQCEAVQYQNICHYLDEISKTLFLDNIEKNNGLYSIHIYNEVNEQAKKRHLAMVKTKDIAKQNSKIDIDPIKVFSLVNDNICRDQVANTQSQCKVFTYDPLGMSRKGKEEIGVSVNVIDLNTQNCVIKTSLQVIDCEEKPDARQHLSVFL